MSSIPKRDFSSEHLTGKLLRADAAEGVLAEAGPQKRADNSPSFVKGTGEDQNFSEK